MKPNAKWVLDFLLAIQATGKHAPVETLKEVADQQEELLDALVDLVRSSTWWYQSEAVGWKVPDEQVVERAREIATRISGKAIKPWRQS